MDDEVKVSKPKRSHRDGSIDKADIFEVMRDRRWHTIAELVLKLKDQVTPEVACRHYDRHYANRKAKTDPIDEAPQTQASYAERVNRGRRAFIRKRLMDSADHGFLDRRNIGRSNEDLEFRWKPWSCWSCAKPSTEEAPKDHLCDECRGVVRSDVPAQSNAEMLKSLMDQFLEELEQTKSERDAAVRRIVDRS